MTETLDWKHCPACGRDLPLDDFHRGSGRGGRCTYCRTCTSERRYEARRRHWITCPRCKQTLPPKAFQPHGQKKRQGYCQTCMVEYNRERRARPEAREHDNHRSAVRRRIRYHRDAEYRQRELARHRESRRRDRLVNLDRQLTAKHLEKA